MWGTRGMVPAALAGMVLAAAGCGSGGDSGGGSHDGAKPTGTTTTTAAVVAGKTITADDVRHWIRVFATMDALPSADPQVSIPDAPTFDRCVASARQTLADTPADLRPKKTPTTSDLRTGCQHTYDSLQTRALQYLVEARWIDGEAKANGIAVRDAAVKQDLSRLKYRLGIGTAIDLGDAGLSERDLSDQARTMATGDALRTWVVRDVKPPTDAQIAAYYGAHAADFALAPRRDATVIEALSAGRARSALAALRAGADPASVARRYSFNTATLRDGGRLLDVTRQSLPDPKIAEALFRAHPGVLTGPIHGQVGWWVFDVTAVKPAVPSSLTSARARVKKILFTQRQKPILASFGAQLQARWRPRTQCMNGFVIPECQTS